MAIADIRNPIVRRTVCIIAFVPITVVATVAHVTTQTVKAFVEAIVMMVDGFRHGWRGH